MRDASKNRLSFIRNTGRRGKSNRMYAEYECKCGTQKEICTDSVNYGTTYSCGCLKKETRQSHGERVRKHGGSYSRVYRVWSNMKDRCLNDRSKQYMRYGGRGITVCKQWLDFEQFLSDMGEPDRGLSIERINNNEGYSNSNCKWGTRKEQGINRRTTKLTEGCVKLIREMNIYNSKAFSNKWIARCFKVDASSISKIVNNITWR